MAIGREASEGVLVPMCLIAPAAETRHIAAVGGNPGEEGYIENPVRSWCSRVSVGSPTRDRAGGQDGADLYRRKVCCPL
jgi:hypothetical protein